MTTAVEHHREEYADVRGVRTRILRAGGGPPLLFLHGSGDRGRWLPGLGLLAERFDVIRPDHPGFHDSAEAEHIDTVHDLAFFYLDLLDELGLERTAVVGSSLGGWLAADLASTAPERVERLVLSDPAGLRADGVPTPDMFAMSPAELVDELFVSQELRDAAVAEAAAMEDDLELLRPYLRSRIATAHLGWNPYLHDPKLPHRLHRAAMPALVLWGAQDGLLPPALADVWAQALPNARVEILPETGHVAHLERPERFAALVTDFLDQGGPA